MKKVQPSGPKNASIMIVGEAPGETEERAGLPFVGASGAELTNMLREAGIDRSACFITNVARTRPPRNDIDKWFLNKTEAKKQNVEELHGRYPLPPITEGCDELHAEISTVQPQLIIALGNTALWALTGEWGITNWRGSYLETAGPNGPIPLIPTYHPAGILRQWSWRSTAIHDLKRAARILTEGVPDPNYEFIIRPTFEQVMDFLTDIDLHCDWVSVDLETKNRHIACIGLGISAQRAICIPLMSAERPEGYWPLDEEVAIVNRLRRILPKKRIIGQNFNYDTQYLIRYWGLDLPYSFDTMIAHAVCFPGTPKGLDYLSSLYCDYHRYWKEEGKEWLPGVPEDEHWTYNCKDCVTTFECAKTLRGVIDHYRLHGPFQFEMDLTRPVLAMQLRGVNISSDARNGVSLDIMEQVSERAAYLQSMIGDPPLAKSKKASPWYTSPIQQRTLFYDQLGIRPIFDRKTKRPTVNDEALPTIAKREPLLIPIIEKLSQLRSLNNIRANFVSAPLDKDGRMRCEYGVVGTETFRFNSKRNPFGMGTNLQNIPRGDDK